MPHAETEQTDDRRPDAAHGSAMASPWPLRTERLTLRPHRAEDIDAVLAYRADPEVARYLLVPPATRADVEERVAQKRSATGVRDPARELALVVEHEGRVVGDVDLWLTDARGASAEIGWAFHPEVAGRGFATEACAAVLRHAFDHDGLHRVVAQMNARNAASAALAERIGMRREALHLQDWWSKGAWSDTFVYAALATDAPRDHGDAVVVSAVLLPDADGRVLTVRKRGTSTFMQPGGKPDPGESPEACALREVAEELGLDLAPERLELTGVHRTRAANEPGRPLLATCYTHPHLTGAAQPEVVPSAEIEEVRWLDPRDPLPPDLAPLLLRVLAD